MPGSVLSKADRASMNWGLEMRSPLLNTKVIMAAMALNEKNNLGGNTKLILRDLLRINSGIDTMKKTKYGFGTQLSIIKAKELIYDKLRMSLQELRAAKTANIWTWFNQYFSRKRLHKMSYMQCVYILNG